MDDEVCKAQCFWEELSCMSVVCKVFLKDTMVRKMLGQQIPAIDKGGSITECGEENVELLAP